MKVNEIKENKENKLKNDYINYILIIIASIIICIPLFSSKFNIFRDDGIQHVSRIIETYNTLEAKEFLPNIMIKLCNNFGYSWNIFYSPLTAYLPLIFKIFNISFVNCLKLFMFLVTLISGFAMYKFIEKVTKNKKIATLGAIFYVLAPYRITDMYIRVAIAELTSFIFIPIVFNGLYTIINEKRKSLLLAFGAIGLILTHTVITLYTAILCFMYLLIFIKKLKDKEILKILGLNILSIILISSFFLVGLLQHYNEGIYEVFVPGRMEDASKLEYFKTRFYQLFYTKAEDPMIFEIGLVIVVGLILTPIAWKKIPNEYKKIYILFLILGLVLTFMTFTFFPFERLPRILKMLQFTFRLFEFTSLFFSFIAAINYGILIKNFKTLDVIVLGIITSLLIIPYNKKIDYDIQENEERLIKGVQVTENTGRIHAGMASMEYLPTNAYKSLRTYIAIREDIPIIKKIDKENINEELKKIKIENYNKNGTNMSFEINNLNEDIKIELPYIYYLGYRVKVNENEIKYNQSENGFIEINLNKQELKSDKVKVEVKYLGTNEMIISYIISIISLVVFIIVEIGFKKSERKIKK